MRENVDLSRTRLLCVWSRSRLQGERREGGRTQSADGVFEIYSGHLFCLDKNKQL